MDISQLPNDIIMNIIKMADGGLNTHKKKMNHVFKDLQWKLSLVELKKTFVLLE